MIFYRPPRTIEATDGFEYSDGWPGTISDINYPLTFNFSTPEVSATENFQSGW